MNNDLISREALKIEIEKQIAYCEDKSNHQSDMEETLRYCNTSYGLRLALICIDNAPTVEINTNDIEYKAYCKGLEDGKKIARPTGEWIIDGHHIRCNKCNEYICNTDREGNKIPDNFCPNCGADMRDGEEE